MNKKEEYQVKTNQIPKREKEKRSIYFIMHICLVGCLFLLFALDFFFFFLSFFFFYFCLLVYFFSLAKT